jgi:hypothetical protein
LLIALGEGSSSPSAPRWVSGLPGRRSRCGGLGSVRPGTAPGAGGRAAALGVWFRGWAVGGRWGVGGAWYRAVLGGVDAVRGAQAGVGSGFWGQPPFTDGRRAPGRSRSGDRERPITRDLLSKLYRRFDGEPSSWTDILTLGTNPYRGSTAPR